ncbi:Co-chaperone Hsc20 [gut metagenome]|uniref:Co-chaperone Hsc20 n=1 Tax=gut metagenome TaxID=749906 RepID=J9GBK6_9ZZZZ
MAAQFSPYQLFGLAPTFAIDENHLEKAYQTAMLKVHPDRFADRSAAERRVAEQWSARINEAHDILKNPVRRAAWLCEAAGFPIRAETDTKMPMDFLLKQMQWREALEAAEGQVEAVNAIRATTEHDKAEILAKITTLIDQDKNWTRAVDLTRQLMFVNRFLEEVERVQKK